MEDQASMTCTHFEFHVDEALTGKLKKEITFQTLSYLIKGSKVQKLAKILTKNPFAKVVFLDIMHSEIYLHPEIQTTKIYAMICKKFFEGLDLSGIDESQFVNIQQLLWEKAIKGEFYEFFSVSEQFAK